MKKSKLITCLSAAFVSAVALMSCSSLVKPRSGVILTIDGVEYTAEDLFNEQKTPAAAEAKFNAVYKVAVRSHFTKGHDGEGDMEEITRNTKIKINEQKATAQSNADKNGTKYDEEWQKILDSNGVEDETGLYNKFEYELQKEKFEDKLYENNYKALREGGKLKNSKGEERGENLPGYLTNKMPYHIKHILVKVSASSGDNVTGTITAEESEKLYNVITELAAGQKTFDKVSELYSDDTAAASAHASLGIMSRDTSFVDDFKLGTYFYEAFYGSATKEDTTSKETGYKSKKAVDELFNKDMSKGAGKYAQLIRDTLADPTSSTPETEPGKKDNINEAIGVIPYEAALKLAPDTKGGYANVDYDKLTILKKAGVSKDNFKDKYLPRNVIFNKYFNKHNIMIIAPAKMPTIGDVFGDNGYIADGSKERTKKEDLYACPFEKTYIETDASKEIYHEGFNRKPKNEDKLIVTADSRLAKSITEPGNAAGDQHILRDENGKTIFVFRSGTGGSSSNEDSGYQGIHFVVIERSPFIGVEYDNLNETGGEINPTTLEEYYTEYYPGQPGGKHPKYDESKEKDWKHTFVNYIMNEPELVKLKERSETVKSELKKCVSDLNTYIYDYLIKDGGIKFNSTPEAQAVEASINNWIKINREDADIEKNKAWSDNWENYYFSLAAKAEERQEVHKGGKTDGAVVSKLIPECCVNAVTAKDPDEEYLKKLYAAFNVGGVWHE